ncbi:MULTISPECIES: hypothetical protein [unclassified Streptomyces]|uniref:hypothetical protein n=1 Tax=unclassified Streptomyces TaxID=2593676 RepID=UPI0033A33A6E
MTDPTAPQPDFTSPIAGRIEVREPCPWCADQPMIPRSLMDEHVARLHPEVQTVDAVAPAVQAPATDRAAVLREAADAVAEMDTDPGTQFAAEQLRRMADEAQHEGEPGCAHCGGAHSWDDCEAYTALVAAEAQQDGARS